jgi:hypothetical protein
MYELRRLWAEQLQKSREELRVLKRNAKSKKKEE